MKINEDLPVIIPLPLIIRILQNHDTFVKTQELTLRLNS